MSPSDIEVLIHYHVCADEHERLGALAVLDGVQWMLDMGLLKPRGDRGKFTASYETTERGAALIDAWCTQPLPEQVWVIPERQKA